MKSKIEGHCHSLDNPILSFKITIRKKKRNLHFPFRCVLPSVFAANPWKQNSTQLFTNLIHFDSCKRRDKHKKRKTVYQIEQNTQTNFNSDFNLELWVGERHLMFNFFFCVNESYLDCVTWNLLIVDDVVSPLLEHNQHSIYRMRFIGFLRAQTISN